MQIIASYSAYHTVAANMFREQISEKLNKEFFNTSEEDQNFRTEQALKLVQNCGLSLRS